MLTVALLLVVVLPLVAASLRIVPPDSVGLVERFGRLIPRVRKPGLVVLRPFIERLLILPARPFPLARATDAELAGGVPLKLTVETLCQIQDVVKFHENVPPAPTGGVLEKAAGFLGSLLESEGRALLREMSPMEFLSARDDFASRLAGRLDWHTRRVGLLVSQIQIARFELPPEEVEKIRQLAEVEKANREAAAEGIRPAPPATPAQPSVDDLMA